MAHYKGYRFFDGIEEMETFISLFKFGTINPPPDRNYNGQGEHYKGYNAFDQSYGNRIIGFKTKYDNYNG